MKRSYARGFAQDMYDLYIRSVLRALRAVRRPIRFMCRELFPNLSLKNGGYPCFHASLVRRYNHSTFRSSFFRLHDNCQPGARRILLARRVETVC
eukprot:5201427-Pyramimonas_sp.AAC.1